VRYAFSTLACPGWRIEQTIQQARVMGYEALELRLLDGEVIDPVAHRERVRQAVALAHEAGIDTCALGSSCYLNQSDPAALAGQVEELHHWIDLASEVRVPIVRVFGGPDRPGTGEDEGNEAVAYALTQVVPQAQGAGVVVALETHDAFSTARRTARVLQSVASPAAGALWDVFHTFEAGESPAKAAHLLAERIAHVHFKDGKRGAAGWDLVLLGEGDLPLVETLQRIDLSGYAGYLSVEWEKKWHPEIAEPEIALPQHLQALRGIVLPSRN
jgi:sugar phosphate isomerase/epimerase